MALTPAEKQARYRARLHDREQHRPDTLERELMQDVERAERGELSDQECVALADMAKDYLWRSHRLAEMARKIRAGKFFGFAAR
jgi:hypothetical protein